MYLVHENRRGTATGETLDSQDTHVPHPHRENSGRQDLGGGFLVLTEGKIPQRNGPFGWRHGGGGAAV
jgi:hypothetical protein